MRDRRSRQAGRTCGFVGALSTIIVVMPFQAHAYIDPGTSAMLAQLVLGGVAGLLVVAKLYWHRIKTLFGFSSDENGTGEENEAQAEARIEARDGE